MGGFFVDFEGIRTASGLDIERETTIHHLSGRRSQGGASRRAKPPSPRAGPIQKCFGKRDVDEMRRDYGKVFDIPFNSKNKYQARPRRFEVLWFLF